VDDLESQAKNYEMIVAVCVKR